jgi:hypothetical protein
MKKKWLKAAVWVQVLLCLLVSPTLNTLANEKNDGNNKGNSQENQNKGNDDKKDDGKKEDDKKEEDKGDQGGHDKVTVCHRGQTLEIARSALPAHLNHGDTIGPCNVTPSQNR